MLNLKKTAIYLSACVAAVSLTTAPAVADECPVDQVRANATPAGPSAPSGVTDEVIASIDLGQGYGVPGRLLRMRRIEIDPGGIVPWHAHNERPANIYVIEGSVTEYRSNCAVPLDHSAGDVVSESGEISHWWRNNSGETALLISADLLPPAKDEDATN